VQATQKLDALFRKQHPGVTIKLETAPTANNAWTTLTNSLLSSKSVDIMAVFPPTPSGFPPASTGLKASGIAALIQSHQLVNMKSQPFMKYLDPTLQSYAIGYSGGIYGMMAAEYDGAGALWYKKRLLQQYHLSVPTTYDQFLHELRVFKSHGITPIFVAGKDGLQAIVLHGIEMQLQMQGKPSSQATKVSEERASAFWNGKENWDSPVFVTAAERYAQIMQYVEPDASGVAQLTAPGVWAAQTDNYPFFVDGSWDGTTIQQANPGLKFGFFTLPGTNDPAANRVPIQPDLTWVVPTWAPEKQLALEWLQLFAQPQHYRQWLDITGSISTEPGISSAKLPWMTWLNAHAGSGFADISGPWVPPGSPPQAGGPDLSTMVPFGSQSVDAALKASAQAYRKSIP